MRQVSSKTHPTNLPECSVTFISILSCIYGKGEEISSCALSRSTLFCAELRSRWDAAVVFGPPDQATFVKSLSTALGDHSESQGANIRLGRSRSSWFGVTAAACRSPRSGGTRRTSRTCAKCAPAFVRSGREARATSTISHSPRRPRPS
jgi:hypothetical protein